jgi:hypothetical protein
MHLQQWSLAAFTLPKAGVRVSCAYQALLPLAMQRCRSSTAMLPDLHPIAIALQFAPVNLPADTS